MIYEPTTEDIGFSEEVLNSYIRNEIMARKDELSWDDRMDLVLIILDNIGYTFQEYADERTRLNEWKKLKKEYPGYKNWRPRDG